MKRKKTVAVGDMFVQKGSAPIVWHVVAELDMYGLPPHVRIAEHGGNRVQAISVSALLENGWFETVDGSERQRVLDRTRSDIADDVEPFVGAAE